MALVADRVAVAVPPRGALLDARLLLALLVVDAHMKASAAPSTRSPRARCYQIVAC